MDNLLVLIGFTRKRMSDTAVHAALQHPPVRTMSPPNISREKSDEPA
jgi:hypothetical protein